MLAIVVDHEPSGHSRGFATPSGCSAGPRVSRSLARSAQPRPSGGLNSCERKVTRPASCCGMLRADEWFRARQLDGALEEPPAISFGCGLSVGAGAKQHSEGV